MESAKKERGREGKVTGGAKQGQSTPAQSSFKDSRPQRLSRDPKPSDRGEAGGSAPGRGFTCTVRRQSWPLRRWSKQAAPGSVGSAAMLLLDGSRQLGLALPRFAAQAETNIQELERRSQLWHSGLGQGLPEKPLVRPPVRASQALSCPLPLNVHCASPSSPAGRAGGSPRPAAAGHGSARALAQWPFGAGHTVGFLANWLPGGRPSGTGAAARAWPQQKAVTAWPASAELCLLAPQPPKEQVPAELESWLSNYGKLSKDI